MLYLNNSRTLGNSNVKGHVFGKKIFFFYSSTRLFEIIPVTEVHIKKKEILASRLCEALLAELFRTRPCSIAKYGEPHIA
jgi:hypothetical protein